MIDASLAQLVEHDTLNVGVQGSSPWGGTKAEDESLPLFFCLPVSCAGVCSDDAAFRGSLVRRSGVAPRPYGDGAVAIIHGCRRCKGHSGRSPLRNMGGSFSRPGRRRRLTIVNHNAIWRRRCRIKVSAHRIRLFCGKQESPFPIVEGTVRYASSGYNNRFYGFFRGKIWFATNILIFE